MNARVRRRLTGPLLAIGLCPAAALGQGPLTEAPFRPFQFMLPVEFSQGVVTDRGHPLPYTLSFRAYPLVVLDADGRWRIGGSTALSYRNPGWEFLAGGRISYRPIILALPENGIDLALEGLLGTDGGDEIALAVTADLARLFRIGVRAARDVSRSLYAIELTLGTDPLKLTPLLSGKRIEDEFER